MIRMTGISITLCALCFSLALARAASEPTFTHFCGGRFGVCVDYPANLKMEAPPYNDDGRGFSDGKGFELSVSGINNILDDTVESSMKGYAESKDIFDKITYRARGKNWFVLSGYKGGDVVYVKVYVGKAANNELHMTYPAQKKNVYDPIAAKISRSFTPGDLTVSH